MQVQFHFAISCYALFFHVAWTWTEWFVVCVQVLAVVSLFSLALALQCLVLLREMFAFEKTNKMEEIIEWHLREQVRLP